MFRGLAGRLLGAIAFFAVDALMPAKAKAGVYGINIVKYSIQADQKVYLVDYSIQSDKKVYVAGKCKGTGGTDVYLVDYSIEADEKWHIVDYSSEADMKMCLSGDIDEWFDQAD